MGTNTKGYIAKEDLKHWDGRSGTFTRSTSSGGSATLTRIDYPGIDILHVYGDGSTGTDSTLNSALNAVGSTSNVTFYLQPGTWTLSADVTLTSNVWLSCPPGVTISVDSGKTFTAYSPENIIASPRQQIFSGSGTVSFTVKGTGYAEWWGIDGTADEVQINKALAACGTVVGIQDYTIADTVTIPEGGSFRFDQKCSVSGGGANQSEHTITPTAACSTAISATVAEGIYLAHVAIDMTNMADGSIGVLIDSCFHPRIDDIAIVNIDDGGSSSIGMKFYADVQGVYWGSVRDVVCYGESGNEQGTGISLVGQNTKRINQIFFSNIRAHYLGTGLTIDYGGGGLTFVNYCGEHNAANGFTVTNQTTSEGGQPVFIGGECSNNGAYGGQGKCLVINMTSATNTTANFDSYVECQRLDDNGVLNFNSDVRADAIAIMTSDIQTVDTTDSINVRYGTIRVQGDGAAKVLTSTPTIDAGFIGQIIILKGGSNTNTVTLQDADTLANSNLRLKSSTVTLGLEDCIILQYDNKFSSAWVEIGRSMLQIAAYTTTYDSDRSINSSSTSDKEIADVLCTLINDLKVLGVIQ